MALPDHDGHGADIERVVVKRPVAAFERSEAGQGSAGEDVVHDLAGDPADFFEQGLLVDERADVRGVDGLEEFLVRLRAERDEFALDAVKRFAQRVDVILGERNVFGEQNAAVGVDEVARDEKARFELIDEQKHSF